MIRLMNKKWIDLYQSLNVFFYRSGWGVRSNIKGTVQWLGSTNVIDTLMDLTRTFQIKPRNQMFSFRQHLSLKSNDRLK